MKLAKHGKESPGPLAPVMRAWTPFWPFNRLQEDIDELFEEPFRRWFAPARGFLEAWGPVVDVYEGKDNIFVKAEIPGMNKEDIEVYMSNSLLNIVGERKAEAEYKGAECYRSERHFGRFHRTVALPAPVEPNKIEAHYKDGVLTVTCPKTEEAKRKEVEVKIE